MLQVSESQKSNHQFKHGNMLNIVNFPIGIMENFLRKKLNNFITLANNVDYCDKNVKEFFHLDIWFRSYDFLNKKFVTIITMLKFFKNIFI